MTTLEQRAKIIADLYAIGGAETGCAATILTALREVERETLERVRAVLKAEPSAQLVQCCCLAYGGGSFSGPMKMAVQNAASFYDDEIRALKQETT